MYGYEIYFNDGTSFQLYFDPHMECIVRINGNHIFSFMHDGNDLLVSQESIFDNDERPIIVSKSELQDINHLEMEKAGSDNCCFHNGQEYCVENGCMVAPCGKICG